MNCPRRLLVLGLLPLAVGWGCTGDPTGPTEAPFCSSRPPSAIATFEDANLKAAIRAALSVDPRAELTCALLGTLTSLSAGHSGIEILSGIQNLTSLTTLRIRANSITDISALSGLTNLGALSGLTGRIRPHYQAKE